MVTAKEEESDVVLGLGVGANDYVVKSFSPKMLMMRVKAMLRRAVENDSLGSTTRIEIGQLAINPEQFVVRLNNQALSMTNTEFRMLLKLTSQPVLVFTREQLLHDAVGEDVIVLDRNIDVHTRAIRKTLGT